MRFNYYRFPEGIDGKIRFEEGCGVMMKDGSVCYPPTLDNAPWDDIEGFEDTLSGISVGHAKALLKKYGGAAWTDHCERDGGVFETTEIRLSGNNSRFTYNRHL